MAFKFMTEQMEKDKEEYLKHVRPEILVLSERELPLTKQELESIRCNSYEWELLLRNCDLDYLLDSFVYYYYNADWSHKARWKFDKLPAHYGEALEQTILPLLAEKLRKQGIGVRK